MTSAGRQILSLGLAVIGFVMTITICTLPTWKSGVDSGSSQVFWEGLWKMCVKLPTGHVQCCDYPPGWIILEDIKAARALIVIAIIVEVFSVVLGVLGSKYNFFMKDERKRYKAAIASGLTFIIAGLFVFISVCWTTYTVSSKRSIYPKTGLAAATYVGWLTAVVLFLGGGLLCRFSRQD